MVKPQVVVRQFYASGASVKGQENRSGSFTFLRNADDRFVTCDLGAYQVRQDPRVIRARPARRVRVNRTGSSGTSFSASNVGAGLYYGEGVS
jgi:hypothetical protein